MHAYTRKNILLLIIGSLVGVTLSCIFIKRNSICEQLKGSTKKLIAQLIVRGSKKKKKKKKNESIRANITNITNNANGANVRNSTNDTIPEECPGVDSENAGKSKICEGCPNRKICNDPELKKEKEKEKNQIFSEVQENLKNVKFKILILSGKGGVGKSTIAAQLAFALSYLNYDVGLLDIDICGPSIPVLTKTLDSDVNYSMNGWIPIYKNNLSIMSVGYLLPNFDDPVIWRGPKKNGLIKQFLCDVYWKNLDFLIIDTPPGTSDEHLTICSYLKNNLEGCLIVNTTHILSICDVKKEIEFCKKTNISILGVVENMYQSIFVSQYTVDRMCSEMHVDYAGSVHITYACTYYLCMYILLMHVHITYACTYYLYMLILLMHVHITYTCLYYLHLYICIYEHILVEHSLPKHRTFLNLSTLNNCYRVHAPLHFNTTSLCQSRHARTYIYMSC
ncbi:cytosolic Fe-S cluster assembly factor NBP35, putative [Plasmodium malariae]|uniref:Cytosolic Fe-S cluster assembly factor NBP35, putative n=1 Tax=Plasmodium malariae TaxID=5858 RepID=A0A1C3KBL5_PLAMA|nr:cytosolic Fe-S cluster assembly factor NBP35, putative [Plasmodium malariae]